MPIQASSAYFRVHSFDYCSRRLPLARRQASASRLGLAYLFCYGKIYCPFKLKEKDVKKADFAFNFCHLLRTADGASPDLAS